MKFKEHWVSVKEFASMRGYSVSYVYISIGRAKKQNDVYFDRKYKKDGGERLVNIAYFREKEAIAEDMQRRFECAYYEAVDKCGGEYALSSAVGKVLGVSTSTAYMYFRNHFTVSRINAVTRRVRYIEAMEKILEETK